MFAKKLNVVSKSVKNNTELDWLVARKRKQLVRYVQRKLIPFVPFVARIRAWVSRRINTEYANTVCFTTFYSVFRMSNLLTLMNIEVMLSPHRPYPLLS